MFAVRSAQAHLAKPGTNPKIKPALQECLDMYSKVDATLLKAGNEIGTRSSSGCQLARTEVAHAASFAQQCEDAFARVGVPSLLRDKFEADQQFEYICLALISILGQ
jgi:pectinesterase inhibitor-like protein